MKIHTPFFAILLMVFSTMMTVHADPVDDARLLAVNVVPWEGVKQRLNSSEIVLLCLVGSYDLEVQREPGDLTPAQMLGRYLSGIRSLGLTPPAGDAGKDYFSKKISIFVVEGGEENRAAPTRDKAEKMHAELGIQNYDRSIPVIYVFQKGKFLKEYTYHQSPGRGGSKLRELVLGALGPDAVPAEPPKPLSPEKAMEKALELRKTKGDKEALAFLAEQLHLCVDSYSTYRSMFVYIWREAQVRSGRTDQIWASMLNDVLFTVSYGVGRYSEAMEVVSNLSSTLEASGRFGRQAEVMGMWEDAQRMGGNKMDLSAYPDLGPAIPCLPEIRHRDIPAAPPFSQSIPAGRRARSLPSGFHVNDAGAFADFAILNHAAGRWRDSMEWHVWVRDWATDKKSAQPIGERATIWYGATDCIIYMLSGMEFHEEALAMTDGAIAAPHGQTYSGRWRIHMGITRLNVLRLLNRAPADIVEQLQQLVEQAVVNANINQAGHWGAKDSLARALIHTGRTKEAEALLESLIAEGCSDSRQTRLNHWIKSGRVEGVEDELKDLLNFSRETGHKLDEIELYSLYADFLEARGRDREALFMRRETVRLSKIFDLFTRLPVEQAKLAVLLLRLGDRAGSAHAADMARTQLAANRLPPSITATISAILGSLEKTAFASAPVPDQAKNIDLQPQRSVVVPLEDAPWTTYLTLANPSQQAKSGRLRVEGPAVRFAVAEGSDDITISLHPSGEAGTGELPCVVGPGAYRLIRIDSAARTGYEGEVKISWRGVGSATTAQSSVTLESPETGVTGAIIQAVDHRSNPFYGVPMHLQYVTKEPAPASPPLRFTCSAPTRVEVYLLDGTPLAIDGQGNGSLLNQGDELFTKSDGAGNLLLPLTNGNAGLSILLYPDGPIPEEGLKLDIEAFTDGKWQLHSSNRLTR